MASLNKQTTAVLSISARRLNFRHSTLNSVHWTGVATSHRKPFTCCADYKAESEIFRNARPRTTGPMLRASYNSFKPLYFPNNS